jgi:Rhodopirellula transposase DDE domain
LTEVHQRAARSEDTLRLSCDAKAPVLIGPFSRGGKSRRGTKGADHDFKPWGKLTPFGIFLPDQRELNFYFTSSKVTSDFIVDRLDQWWQGNRERYPQIRKLLLVANRQRIANMFPPAHRSVFVISDRRIIASIGGGGDSCWRR